MPRAGPACPDNPGQAGSAPLAPRFPTPSVAGPSPRHFGLVVDDKQATREALERAGAEILPARGLDFRDPWGNRVQVVDYREAQFTKAPALLRAVGLDDLEKTPSALAEMREKGLLG